MKLSPNITLIPFLHGKAYYAQLVRRLFSEGSFDCVAIDLPPIFEETLPRAVEQLPYISAVMAWKSDDHVYYIATDPCDAVIEAIRQALQLRIPYTFVGYPDLYEPPFLPPMPDPYAIQKLGSDAFVALCTYALGNPLPHSPHDRDSRHIAARLRWIEKLYRRIVVFVHFRHVVRTVYHYFHQSTDPVSKKTVPPYRSETAFINPDHLYFALGELPFIAGKWEQERLNPFVPPLDITETIKELFRETREEYFDPKNPAVDLSPTRLQAGLKFLRNLTIMSGSFIPTLFDIVVAAKGIGGNSFALRILKSAKYYPFLPLEKEGPMVGVGIDKISLPFNRGVHDAVNLLRDTAIVWRTLPLKGDQPPQGYSWRRQHRFWVGGTGMCSHLPEDRTIENFNAQIRSKARRLFSEDFAKTVQFTSSLMDGVDIRETLRNWYTNNIYVKEIPPFRGSVDTVVIIFDAERDHCYPHQAVWYAEHEKESTLTFYATDPLANVIGPGVARSFYGGLSMLFPPRIIPSAFDITRDLTLDSLAEQLTYGAIVHSSETIIVYLAARRPSLRLKVIAASHRKHLLWIPLSSFSAETLRRLRRFHVLNGKIVRSWASHFIGD